MVTLLPLDYLLHKHVGFRPIHQLMFVVRHEWLLIQSDLTLWLVYMLQASLDHYGSYLSVCGLDFKCSQAPVFTGYDFSFRFAWLH
jgi:hypothetical protein